MNRLIWVSCLLPLVLLNLGCGSKNLSQRQAVRAAENFVRLNGYTDFAPLLDTSKLTFESIEVSSKPPEILKFRHNTLNRKAYGFVRYGRGKPGWTIAFRYKDSRISRVGRAVTMDLDGKNARMEHKSIFLSACQKL